MPYYSPLIGLSHAISAHETSNLQQDTISPDLFICGITKLQDTRSMLYQLDLPPEVMPLIRDEYNTAMDVLYRHIEGLREFRRELRRRIGKGETQREDDEHISRAQVTKDAFDRAEELAADAPFVSVLHLLAALLEVESTAARLLLAEQTIDWDAIHEQAAAYRPLHGDEPPQDSATMYSNVKLTIDDAAPPLTLIREYEDEQYPPFEFTKSHILIGRETRNNRVDLDLGKDGRVHRKHARIIYEQGAWWVEAIGSQGVTVNDTRVEQGQRRRLKGGDRITVGNSIIHVDHVHELNEAETAGIIDEVIDAGASHHSPEISEDERIDIFTPLTPIIKKKYSGRELFNRVLDALQELFPQAVDWTLLPMIDGHLTLYRQGSYDTSIFSMNLIKRALERGEAFRWQPRADAVESNAPSVEGISSAICAPLVFGGSVVGAISITASLNSGHVFEAADVHRLEQAAMVIASALNTSSHDHFPWAYVAYDKADLDDVLKLAGELRRRGVRVWLSDDSIPPGEKITDAITAAISAVNVVLIYLTPDSKSSSTLLNQLTIANENCQHIIPVVTDRELLPDALADVQPATIDMNRLETTLSQLVTIIYDHQEKEPKDCPEEDLPVTTILFAASNPLDTVRLDLENEMREIDIQLKLAPHRSRFDLQSIWAVQQLDLSRELQGRKPHILHFSGHGNEAGEIMVRNPAGEAVTFTPENLSRLIAAVNENLQVVVLNGCWTAPQAEAIREHVPCVIGMTRAISDEAAFLFSGGFYQSLAHGNTIHNAFEVACSLLSDEAETPIIDCQTGFDPHTFTFI
jgi:hypothetical protein